MRVANAAIRVIEETRPASPRGAHLQHHRDPSICRTFLGPYHRISERDGALSWISGEERGRGSLCLLGAVDRALDRLRAEHVEYALVVLAAGRSGLAGVIAGESRAGESRIELPLRTGIDPSPSC